MVTVTIRNVPDEVRDVYAARAKKAGVSLQEYMRGWLQQLVATPTDEELDELMTRRAEELRARGEWP